MHRAASSKSLCLLVCLGVLVAGCVEGGVEGGGQNQLRMFAEDYDNALDAPRRDLPTKVRAIEDIKLLSRAARLAAACVPGRNPIYSRDWFDENRDKTVRTSHGRRTVEEIADDCSRMLKKVEKRSVEACGARYVQLERHLADDDSWSTPRVTRTSEGWYMTPCDKTPSAPAFKELKELKDAEESIREACDDPKASYYLLARWSEEPGGKGMVASVACILPRQVKSNWLPGNPALGIK